MNFEELLKNRKIEKLNKKQEPDFSLAENDIRVAKDNYLSKNFEWALVIAYNSVLRASRELMFYLSYRAIGKEKHKNTFEFLRETKFNEEMIEFFDKIRIKRNNNIYDIPEDLSEEFVDEIIKKAEDFVREIRTFVLEIRT
ncbi:MAG: HEPN domain-containing protein [Nanoarchaeota archaeon]|nr:HEPN domain-containing protein [Nanoarchaeota archaeon]